MVPAPLSSLGTRLAAMTTLVILVMSGLVFFQLARHERGRLVASKTAGADMVMRLVAADLSPALDFGDVEDVRSRLENLKTNEDIVAATVWKAGADEPLASWTLGGSPLEPPDPNDVGRWTTSADATTATYAIVSREGATVAYLRTVFSLARENEAYRARRQMLLWLTVGLAAATAALLIAISRLEIVRPLARLADTVRRFERGERDARAAKESKDEIGALAHAFNTMANAVAQRQAQLEAAEARFRLLIETMPDAVILSQGGRITYVNPSFVALTRIESADCTGKTLAKLVPKCQVEGAPAAASTFREERWEIGDEGIAVELRERAFELDGAAASMVLARDITERRHMQAQLLQSDKLAAIGTLAAGVAHEINTPIQFVSDSVFFVQDAVKDLVEILEKHRVATRAAPAEAAAAAVEAEEALELPFLLENIPSALARSIDGLGRIASIVRSLKVFAHPERNQMAPTDINEAVTSTLTIARHEYKYAADVVTELGELPLVTCSAGDVNQALLNVIVNAAHAIGEVVKDTEARGTIRVQTRQEGDRVIISISDTGLGIPVAVQPRIFEPFFTTKGVGKGTGQGLSIARSLIAEKHGGSLTFETKLGAGTTFHIQLPIGGRRREGATEVAA
jgi:PAS domain S-box-containing protein